MTTSTDTDVDIIERAIEAALRPGHFFGYGEVFQFVQDLENVADSIAALIPANPSNASRAVSLFETFLGACYEKAGELDDSSGSFGMFVGRLYCGWVSARQAAHADPEDTADMLATWIKDDEQGYCSQLERDLVKVLDEPGLLAFRNHAAEFLEEYLAGEQQAKEPLPPAATYARRRWEAVLRTIFEHQGDVEAYLALCERTETSPQDCLVIARMLHARQQPTEALTWVERGLKLDQERPHRSGAEFDLTRVRRQLLLEVGRGEEALDETWARFQKHPSEYSYQELMEFVSEPERAAWRARALDAAGGAELDSLIKLLVVAGDVARLANRIRQASDEELEDVSHFTSEPAAKALEAGDPDLAARLHQAMGMRILKGGKSKYYDAALGNLRYAKRCYERAGLDSDWQAVIARVRSDHRRKVGFIADFEKVVAGAEPAESKPSFLDRAKARWNEK